MAMEEDLQNTPDLGVTTMSSYTTGWEYGAEASLLVPYSTQSKKREKEKAYEQL